MESYLAKTDWKERLRQYGIYNVALYGAGKYGRAALENIRRYMPQLRIVCFLDDNKIRNNADIDGIEVMSLKEAMEEKEDFHILITNYYVLSTLEKIEKNGFDIDRAFFWGGLLIEDVGPDVLEANRENLKRAFESLSDYQSKAVFRNMVESRYTKNIDLLGRTCQKKQYFPEDIFTLGAEEVFVDGGAFDGDTICQFLEETGGKFRRIYAFEPDMENYRKLKENCRDERIVHYNGGLWNETAELSFSANKGGSSKVEAEGGNRIQAYKFDDLDSLDENITFIKMDIEGAELNALYGMEQTIKRCKPKLAICIYHKFEDLWELPLYIRKLVPEYKLYIRNYTTYLDEIVLYAVL